MINPVDELSDIYLGQISEADNSPDGWVKLSRKQMKLRRGDKLNEIINRQFEEL